MCVNERCMYVCCSVDIKRVAHIKCLFSVVVASFCFFFFVCLFRFWRFCAEMTDVCLFRFRNITYNNMRHIYTHIYRFSAWLLLIQEHTDEFPLLCRPHTHIFMCTIIFAIIHIGKDDDEEKEVEKEAKNISATTTTSKKKMKKKKQKTHVFPAICIHTEKQILLLVFLCCPPPPSTKKR